VLVEIGDDQEQAASTLGASRWQTFRRITLPSIRWGVAYGVILSTARALGEIGAVLVVSSLVAGQTLSLPLLVYQRAMDIGAASTTGDYAAATELAVISLVVLLVMTILSPRRDTST
jgi:sulfate transport system permease protein